MKTNSALSALVLGVAAVATVQAQAPSKVAIIRMQEALVATKDGQKAQADLQAKFGSRRQTLEKEQSNLAAMQDQLTKGGATMSDAAKQKMAADLESGKKKLQRDGEDFDSDVQQEEGKIMQDLGQKMMDVIIKYATQNGYSMVIDVSNQQNQVLWADQSVNITEPVVKLYDQAHPGAGSAAAQPAAPPTAPRPTATSPLPAPKQNPPATPPSKKQ